MGLHIGYKCKCQQNLIEGGDYLLIYSLIHETIFGPVREHVEMHQLMAVQDDNGFLFNAWDRAMSGPDPGGGPLLPHSDSQLHEHLIPFNHWRFFNDADREKAFNYWAETITSKFMQNLTPQNEEKRQANEISLIIDMLSNEGSCRSRSFLPSLLGRNFWNIPDATVLLTQHRNRCRHGQGSWPLTL